MNTGVTRLSSMAELPRLRLVQPKADSVPRGNNPSLDRGIGDTSAVELSDALEDVVRRFGNFMRRTAHRHNLGAGEIDEVMQDTRIRLWKALGTSDNIRQAPASYIYRTVTSAALDFLRRRRARREDSLDEAAETAVSRALAPHAADHNQRAAEVGRAVANAVELLVESRRAVIRMYLAGFEREEIQEVLGWSEAKTRNLLYRGLADMRATLESQGYGPGGAR
jgi:RNA polymerase sigma-70 factor (ECF subfamily)